MASKSMGVKDITNSTLSNSPTLLPSNSPRLTASHPQKSSPSKQPVYRPCARCRVKKTKCDRLKPTCTSCVKAGPDVICKYDNNEPVSDPSNTTTIDEEYQSSTSMSMSTNTLGSSNIFSSSSPKKELPVDPKYSDTKKAANFESSNKPRSTAKSLTNRHDRPPHGTEPSIKVETASSPNQQLFDENKSSTSSSSEPSKKLKSGQSEAIRPSPLRSSITTNRIPTSKSSSDIGTKSNRKQESINDENVDIESMDGVEDKDRDVLGLSIAHAVTDQQSEAYQDEISDTMDTLTKRSVNRQRKQARIPTTAGSTGNTVSGAQKIMSDLGSSKSAQPFVIDKNQRARKWGRSSAIVQTLGGEITLPLWVSDQEMLLNEPRPYFIQRSYLMPSVSSSTLPGGASATATNLARMAVMNQKENAITGYDTPERGTSPDSCDSSPSATMIAAPSPRTKKRRGQKRPQSSQVEAEDMESQSMSGAKRKRGGPSSSVASAKSSGGGDEDAGDSSARSTPAPSSRPRSVPTRPRMYPCSFEGCTKSFMDKFHLKRHETRHVTQVIVCGIDGCTKAYDSISTMRRHRSMIHKERKEEIAAEERAAAAAGSLGTYVPGESRSSGDGDGYGDGDGEGDIEGEGEEIQSDISQSPAPSSAAYTTVSSPARDYMQ